MSDVVVGGDTLVSTTRAAELSGYSKDYIGQLCRGGKLECRRISGHWYVDGKSIKQYQQKDTQVQQHGEKRAQPAFGSKVGNVRDDTFSYDGVEYVATSRGAELTGYAQDYVGQLARNGEIKARKVGRRWFVGRESLTEHKKHNDGLLASVQAQASGIHSSAPITIHKPEHAGVAHEDGNVEIEIHKNVEPGDINFNVRYISETDQPLVPTIPARTQVKKEYAPGDMHTEPAAHTGASKVVPRARQDVGGSIIGEPRYAKARFTPPRAHIIPHEQPTHDAVFSPVVQKGTGGLGKRALFVALVLISLILGFSEYFFNVSTQASTLFSNMLSGEIISSLSDSYGDVFPGSEYEYAKE